LFIAVKSFFLLEFIQNNLLNLVHKLLLQIKVTSKHKLSKYIN
jgi:hypothetical protein